MSYTKRYLETTMMFTPTENEMTDDQYQYEQWKRQNYHFYSSPADEELDQFITDFFTKMEI